MTPAEHTTTETAPRADAPLSDAAGDRVRAGGRGAAWRGRRSPQPLQARARARRLRPAYLLVVLCVGAIVAAVLVVAPPSSQSTTPTRTARAAEGVVQSTVSGSGNVQPMSQLNLGFKTSGVISRILVSQGQHVTKGQLLAELDPKGAEVTLEQAKAQLQAAEATLAQEEEAHGETASAQGSASSSASHRPGTETHKQSAATREANLASARASVRSDKLAVEDAEQTVANTKLDAPSTGTLVSLSGEVGETASGNGTSKTQASASGESTSGSSAARSSAASSRAGAAGASGSGSTGQGSAGSSGSSSAAFAVFSNLSSMQLVVPLSESEIAHVRDGQPATVTVEALEGTKLAAQVVSVATLATTSSGVVSYDVSFQLDQTAAGLKPGMSATAEVVVGQEEGVNVPTSAITGQSVTVLENGHEVRRRVVTGLAGNSSTIIRSGLRAGEQVVLPTVRASSASSLGSRLGGRLGGAGAGAFPGGGGGAFLRGGGG